MDRLAVAKHEAAHIVVGVALGLRMRRAVLRAHSTPRGSGWFDLEFGHVLFAGNPQGAQREALAIMYAAGVAWDKDKNPHDAALVRELVPHRHAQRAFVRAAKALLYQLADVQARVTTALLERDLTGSDITAIARGERIE